MTVAVCVLSLVLIAREWFANEERKRWELERQTLLQRIQAPEAAVMEHTIGTAPIAPPAVALEEDQDYWAAAQEKMDDFMGEVSRWPSQT